MKKLIASLVILAALVTAAQAQMAITVTVTNVATNTFSLTPNQYRAWTNRVAWLNANTSNSVNQFTLVRRVFAEELRVAERRRLEAEFNLLSLRYFASNTTDLQRSNALNALP